MGMHTRLWIVIAVALAACGPKSVGSTAGADMEDTGTDETSGDAGDTGDTGPSTETGLMVAGTGLGAPCDHGHPTEIRSKLLTYPHADCDGNACLYADETQPPSGPCRDDSECGPIGTCDPDPQSGEARCVLDPSYVTARSMCSQVCESDAECVTDEATTCQGGFTCARVSSLGELCCQRLCVCVDDLGVTAGLDQDCASGTVPGCCIDGMGNEIEPQPPGCGVP